MFVLKKYEDSNNVYGYILCIMNISSRKAWVYPLKTKRLMDTTPAVENVFSSPRLYEFNKKY
jgi:hypothetical protein